MNNNCLTLKIKSFKLFFSKLYLIKTEVKFTDMSMSKVIISWKRTRKFREDYITSNDFILLNAIFTSPCFFSTLLLTTLSIVHWELCCNWFLSWFISANVDSKERLLHVLIPLCDFKSLDYSINNLYKLISSMNIGSEDFTAWQSGKGAQCVSFMIMLSLRHVRRRLFFSPTSRLFKSHLSLDTSNHFSKITWYVE